MYNPNFPWRPSHSWDHCPGCFENFDMDFKCDHCGGGHEDKPFTYVDLNQSMESALILNEANVMFVCVPVFNHVELEKLRKQAIARLENRSKP